MVRDKAPDVMESHGISKLTVAEMLILVGDNPERIRSEAALAKLCGVCPIPASGGKTNRMRLNRGGNRQANAALYRVIIVRMRDDDETKTCAARRTAEGETRRETVRCIKRYIVREIFNVSGARMIPPADYMLYTIETVARSNTDHSALLKWVYIPSGSEGLSSSSRNMIHNGCSK